ncbi:hypothetical protein GCG54_00015312 [Colletotrichum gloeosporioides]|uniref:Uncharacterized protein n=1 Tax=Colletotrichum gloeosporioides TaxID=474922 RepID=A0A8H4FEN6_COLGL|nr:uncharacterized protein GCG54_00015312 [Colletotrichum gloeosporioides]KAF3799130.1 hypothetical protein GCG54_00015312 [Colletotrichum gloeosporioides]
MDLSDTTAQVQPPSSPPIHIRLEADDDDRDDCLMLPTLNHFSKLVQDNEDHDAQSLIEFVVANDLLEPDDPLLDSATPGHLIVASHPGEDNNQGDESEHESRVSTPQPEPIPLWTENEAHALTLFLQTTYGPLTVGQVAEQMDRSATEATAMIVCTWLSAIRVLEGRDVPWWVGRPVVNSIGLGRVAIFMRNGTQVVLRLYDTQGELDIEVPIDNPSQVYEYEPHMF